MKLKLHNSSSTAILCYFVTVLLLYLIGDVFTISWLQFAKVSQEEHTLRSFSPFLLSLPVYAFVRMKTR